MWISKKRLNEMMATLEKKIIDQAYRIETLEHRSYIGVENPDRNYPSYYYLAYPNVIKYDKAYLYDVVKSLCKELGYEIRVKKASEEVVLVKEKKNKEK